MLGLSHAVGLSLQREGIFRVSGQVGDEGAVRRQLARGTIPENLDVHALAGLIKVRFASAPSIAWFEGFGDFQLLTCLCFWILSALETDDMMCGQVLRKELLPGDNH